jgi:hypothetical protein
MRKSIFLVGSLILVIGFVLYQLGFSYELHQTLLGKWMAQFAKPVISWGLSLEVFAVVLEFTGGLLAMFGFVLCFASVARSGGTRVIEHIRVVTNCRFCGAEIDKDSLFCKSCNKSQG